MTCIRKLFAHELFQIFGLAFIVGLAAAPLGALAYIALTIDLYSRVQ